VAVETLEWEKLSAVRQAIIDLTVQLVDLDLSLLEIEHVVDLALAAAEARFLEQLDN
jgi:hypothetical protein